MATTSNVQITASDGLVGSGACPHVSAPTERCYCRHMTSLQVPDAVFYCTRNYLLCPVYRSMDDNQRAIGRQ